MEFRRLFDVFYYQQHKNPLEVAMAEKVEGKWITYSTADVIKRVNELSRGMYHYGLRPGDKISIISTNRPLWTWIDIAVMQIGCINVPVYPNISIEDYLYIFQEAEVKVVFVQDKALYNKINSIRHLLPSLQAIFTFNEVADAPHYKELLLHEQEIDHTIIEAIAATVQPDDLATIIYTSGTTGNPKGVMLSHNNIISNAVSASSVICVKTYMRVVSSLPLCHVFERMVCFVFYYIGMSVFFADKVENLGEYLREVKPHFFTTVPRLMEKVYERIMAKGNELTGIKKTMFNWAMRLADKYDPDRNQGPVYGLQLYIARKLVFSKWHEALGGEVVGVVSGGAALQPRLAKIFNAAGIGLREGYGQSEASPVIAVNRYGKDDNRIGTVGEPIPGVAVKIGHDGEILVKGPNVMLGYYKNPTLTAETIDADGWLHTGDIGILDGKFLKITDRKKELFKTSGGKYIAPQVIENKFKESFLIEQIMVVGENRKSISAIIVPAIPSLQKWCESNGLGGLSVPEMIEHPMVLKKYAEIRNEFNKQFSDVEKVKRFTLVAQEWTVDSGDMTPTLKLKRRILMEKYKDVLAELYNED